MWLAVKLGHEVFIFEISEVLKLGAIYEFIAKEETEEDYRLVMEKSANFKGIDGNSERLRQSMLPLYRLPMIQSFLSWVR